MAVIIGCLGGGNYLEYQSLEELKARERTHVRSITYGSTSLCASESFLAALASLGEGASCASKGGGSSARLACMQ